MKLFLVFALGCLAVSALSTFGDDPQHVHGENGWYFPSKNGTFYWMEMEKFAAYERAMENSRALSLTPTKFYLYTQKNSKKAQEITNTSKSIKKSNFNPDHPTKFIIHGFLDGKSSNVNKYIRKSFLAVGECNVIVTVWDRSRSEYFLARSAVPKVGEKVANMIDYLVFNQGMKIDNVTVVGHSLGAHIAGFAGKHTKAGPLPIIIGLDPALPGFDYKKPNQRLNENDADYVETIQTNGGVLGFLMPIGKAAFYPNGGEHQPGCLTDICSHARSILYYAEAVKENNFLTTKCQSLSSAVSQTCGTTYSSSRMCSEENPVTAEGIFYVPVNKKHPFGVLN